MEDLVKSLRVNRLLDTYGDLLTDNQRNMISYHYGMDLSLGEISEELNVSRNAVYDSIKKGIALLENYEEKLHLLANEDSNKVLFDEIKKDRTDEEIKLISFIEERIK